MLAVAYQRRPLAHEKASERGYGPFMAWQLGRYEVYDRIASGGMADVFLGRMPIGTSAYCALKVLRSDLGSDLPFREMFSLEARLMKALSHPATIQVYEIGESE